MGFFSKIKDNFKHGGVQVRLQAPASASMNDATVPVSVSITNSGTEQQTIKRIRVEIEATSQNKNFDTSSNTVQPTPTTKTVAQTDNNEQFSLMPNESKTVQINIVMNAGAAVAAQLPPDSALGQIAGAVQKLESVGEAMSPNAWTYEVSASADVDGITFDPSDNHPIQILKPGEFGTATNLNARL